MNQRAGGFQRLELCPRVTKSKAHVQGVTSQWSVDSEPQEQGGGQGGGRKRNCLERGAGMCRSSLPLAAVCSGRKHETSWKEELWKRFEESGESGQREV